jgi:RNA polymerase sigma-70 factor (ECF subfamily)
MPDLHDDVVWRLVEACRCGDLDAFRAALTPDAVAVCDGGGVVPAALGPVRGADDVADLATALLRCGQPGAELTVEAVNGRPGLALRRAGQAIAVVAVTVDGTEAAALWIVLNPAKLRGWHRS